MVLIKWCKNTYRVATSYISPWPQSSLAEPVRIILRSSMRIFHKERRGFLFTPSWLLHFNLKNFMCKVKRKMNTYLNQLDSIFSMRWKSGTAKILMLLIPILTKHWQSAFFSAAHLQPAKPGPASLRASRFRSVRTAHGISIWDIQ